MSAHMRAVHQIVRADGVVPGRVYAFEPGSYARTILRSVVWLHRLDNVTIVPAALGAEAGTAALNMPIKASGARGFGLAHLGDAEARWASVARKRWRKRGLERVAVAGFGLDRLDFLKADIEGWEVQMLQGARDALRRFRPRLVLELTAAHLARAGDTLDGAFRLLAELGYCAFLLRPDGRLAPAGPGEGDFWFLPQRKTQ